MVNISVYENFYNNQSVKGWGKGEQPILFCGNIPLEIGLKTMFYGVLAVDDYIFITQSLLLEEESSLQVESLWSLLWDFQTEGQKNTNENRINKNMRICTFWKVSSKWVLKEEKNFIVGVVAIWDKGAHCTSIHIKTENWFHCSITVPIGLGLHKKIYLLHLLIESSDD